MPPHPTRPPLCASCSSGQCFACGFLQIPPHDGHPCRPANDSPYQARSELSSYRNMACRAYTQRSFAEIILRSFSLLAYASKLIGSGGPIRTDDLWVMHTTSAFAALQLFCRFVVRTMPSSYFLGCLPSSLYTFYEP